MGLPEDAASIGARDEGHNGEAVDAWSRARDGSLRHGSAARVRRLATAALIVVLVVAAGYLTWDRFHEHQKEIAEAQALDAARKYAVALTTIDARAVDQTVAAILDGSTGEFKALYGKSRNQLRRLLVDNQAVGRGHVVEAAVKSASANKVEVLLFVDQSITNRALPKPQIDRSRLRMTLEKVGDRWLVSRVELP